MTQKRVEYTNKTSYAENREHRVNVMQYFFLSAVS